MTDVVKTAPCAWPAYRDEPMCEKFALLDEVKRLRTLFEAVGEIAEAPINDYETEANRLDMILRLANKALDTTI